MDTIENKIIKSERVANATLLVGTHAESLKQQALLFAKKLNCLEAAGCNACNACKKIEKNIHPDVIWIESQGESIKIEPLRELQRTLHLKPYEGRWKVVIIDGAQHLTLAASNSLLKILEEPPAQTTFLLLAPHAENLLSTITSRCQRIRLSDAPPPNLDDIENLNSLLSLPVSLEERFQLAIEISKDDETFQKTLEIWTLWYHDLLFYKQGLSPFESPLHQKAALAQTQIRTQSISTLYDKLKTVLETQKTLKHYQVNRQWLAEHVVTQLSLGTSPA
ncbi:MAG: hypothetical protein A3B70_05035 [Deltaproteobacteria bacterium RIFCSPHIGHO2_02_FULL_40_11]|nr:MAG: hypothetical protein A3B70_05035 [Deltaproteobacteria bacterium RIFCSPHIGHO2_02_FULL_40_11]